MLLSGRASPFTAVPDDEDGLETARAPSANIDCIKAECKPLFTSVESESYLFMISPENGGAPKGWNIDSISMHNPSFAENRGSDLPLGCQTDLLLCESSWISVYEGEISQKSIWKSPKVLFPRHDQNIMNFCHISKALYDKSSLWSCCCCWPLKRFKKYYSPSKKRIHPGSVGPTSRPSNRSCHHNMSPSYCSATRAVSDGNIFFPHPPWRIPYLVGFASATCSPPPLYLGRNTQK